MTAATPPSSAQTTDPIFENPAASIGLDFINELTDVNIKS